MKHVKKSKAFHVSLILPIRVFIFFICQVGNFRRDGKLLTAGDEKGTVKLFDVETKTMLRQAQPHSS